jgi:hypothetical protein
MKAFAKITKPFRPDYLKGRVAAVCPRILDGEKEGNKFTRMIRMQVAKKDVGNLRDGKLGFEQPSHRFGA